MGHTLCLVKRFASSLLAFTLACLVHASAVSAQSGFGTKPYPGMGGMQEISWRGLELTEGGGFYIIASCPNLTDDPATNLTSFLGTGTLTPPSGVSLPNGCAGAPYRLSYTGNGRNALRVRVDVGPLPTDLGVVSIAGGRSLVVRNFMTPATH